MINLKQIIEQNSYRFVKNIERGLTYRIIGYDEVEGLINCRCEMNNNVIIPLPIEVDVDHFSNPLVIYGNRCYFK
jgi:hypothetical protein